MALHKTLQVRGTRSTPDVFLSSGIIRFTGRSIPEDAGAFYRFIINWIDRYLQNPAGFTEIIFKFEYLNSSTNRYIHQILAKFDESYKNGAALVVCWFYDKDDDSILTLGDDFRSIFELPFRLTENP